MSLQINGMFVAAVWKVFVWRLILWYEEGSDLSSDITEPLRGFMMIPGSRSKLENEYSYRRTSPEVGWWLICCCFSLYHLLSSWSRLRSSVSWVIRTSFSFMERCWNPPTMALSQVRLQMIVCMCVEERKTERLINQFQCPHKNTQSKHTLIYLLMCFWKRISFKKNKNKQNCSHRSCIYIKKVNYQYESNPTNI